jgi:hypothetical protein
VCTESLILLSGAGPDADRHAKPLIYLAVEGSLLGAYSQAAMEHQEIMPNTRSLMDRSINGEATIEEVMVAVKKMYGPKVDR